MEWPKAARDHETFCVSCHTAVPYALSRSTLRNTACRAQLLLANEHRLLDNVTKRVRLWKAVDSVLHSDVDRGVSKLARVARNGIRTQRPDPCRAVTRGAANSATRPLQRWITCGLNNKLPASRKERGSGCALRMSRGKRTIQATSERRLPRSRLVSHRATIGHARSQNQPQAIAGIPEPRIRRADPYQSRRPLWASAKLPGLLEPDRQEAIIAELLGKQQADGGWSLSSLSGSWNERMARRKKRSYGYATGLITFVLQQVGTSLENAQLKQGLAWLTANQDRTEGSGRPTL